MKPFKPLHWQTHEYEPRERSNDWFWAVGIITVAIVVTAIIFNNVLFALVMFLAGFSLSLYAARPPQIMDVVLDEIGVRVDRHFYPYRSLESFWVEEHDGLPRIFLKSQKLIMPYIIIPISEEASLEKIKRFLDRHLPEVFHSESMLEKMMERMGF
jgi:hypothetical protein